MECICTICGKAYIYKRKTNTTMKKCNNCAINHRRHELKKRAVELLGGKCSVCGYNKSIKALQFHHIDPSQKSFVISGQHCRSWKKIEEEIKKCILLCANCHAELHYD